MSLNLGIWTALHGRGPQPNRGTSLAHRGQGTNDEREAVMLTLIFTGVVIWGLFKLTTYTLDL
jgi:hypothetical protein